MQLAEILGNEELRRHEFPVCRDKIFLAHAGDCPLPRRVSEAVSEYVLQAATGDQERFVYPGILEKGRAVSANLLGCQADEFASINVFHGITPGWLAPGSPIRSGAGQR